MTVKINVEKYLGIKKPIEVKATVKNTRKVYEMQLKLAKMNKAMNAVQDKEADSDSMIKMIESVSNILTECESFVLEILNLDDKYIAKLEDLTQEQLIELVTHTTSVFMGVDAEKVDDSKKE